MDRVIEVLSDGNRWIVSMSGVQLGAFELPSEAVAFACQSSNAPAEAGSATARIRVVFPTGWYVRAPPSS